LTYRNPSFESTVAGRMSAINHPLIAYMGGATAIVRPSLLGNPPVATHPPYTGGSYAWDGWEPSIRKCGPNGPQSSPEAVGGLKPRLSTMKWDGPMPYRILSPPISALNSVSCGESSNLKRVRGKPKKAKRSEYLNGQSKYWSPRNYWKRGYSGKGWK